jgi:hypothetical protein
MKVSRHMFSDSKFGSKLSCGRTRAEALVIFVLAPSSVTVFLENLEPVYLLCYKLITWFPCKVTLSVIVY